MRIYSFFAMIILTIAAMSYSILIASGFQRSGVSDKYLVFANELGYIASSLEKRLGSISSMALQMGARISKSAENFLNERYMTANDLRLRTDLLKDLLASQFDNIMFSLAQSRTTGAFMILNSTVSARMQDAVFSRAGLYILNWEPDLIVDDTQQFQLFRGPSRIAIERELVMENNWALEFNIDGANYFTAPQKYAVTHTNLTRQICLWNPMEVINGSTYKAMLCSVPLADSQGNLLGVCGFDVSELYFKHTFGPTEKNFKNIFCALAPLEGNRMDLSRAMISWRHLVEDEPAETTTLISVKKEGEFNLYTSNIGTEYVGLHKSIKIQPVGLPFEIQEFALALLVPKKDFDEIYVGQRRAVVGIFAAISAVGLLMSYFFNKIYVRPIIEAFGNMRGVEEENAPYSVDMAIDMNSMLELMDERAQGTPQKPRNEQAETTIVEDFSVSETEREFSERIKTLTSAERKVFDLYTQGYTASDISRELNISLNTVKTHNKNIMAKMQAASKRELISTNIKMLKNENQTRQK